MSVVDEGRAYVRPKVVDAGHHTRRLLRLTGLDAEENQARRLLNDLDAYRAESDLPDEQLGRAPLADRGLRAGRPGGAGRPAPQARAVRAFLAGRSSTSGCCPNRPAATSGSPRPSSRYLTDVLVHRPDEQAILGVELS